VEVTPHIAALTQRKRTIRQIVDKLHQLERGEAVAGLVDASAGY
jgi:glyoxylate/hydroxypyruvate reductase A